MSVIFNVYMSPMLSFVFFYDTVGQNEGKTNYVAKYTSLSFMTSGICIRLMLVFTHPEFYVYIYHIFY